MGNIFDQIDSQQPALEESDQDASTFLQWMSNHYVSDYRFMRPEVVSVTMDNNLLETLQFISTHGFTAIPCLEQETNKFLRLIYLEDIIAVILQIFHSYRNNHPDQVNFRQIFESFHLFRTKLTETRVSDLNSAQKYVVLEETTLKEMNLLRAATIFSDPERDVNRIVIIDPESKHLKTIISSTSLMRVIFKGFLNEHPSTAVDTTCPIHTILDRFPQPHYEDSSTPVFAVLDHLYRKNISAAVILQDGVPVTQFSRSDIKLLVRPNSAFKLPAQERNMNATMTLSEREANLKLKSEDRLEELGDSASTPGTLNQSQNSSPPESQLASDVATTPLKPQHVPVEDGYDAFLCSALMSPVGKFISIVRQRQLMCSTPLASISLNENLIDACAKMNAMYIHQVYVKNEESTVVGVIGIRQLWIAILGRFKTEDSIEEEVEKASQKHETEKEIAIGTGIE